MLSDEYYIELAEYVHKAVVSWDPVGLISAGSPKDEYDLIEKRFLSGIINLDSDDDILNKVLGNLEELGVDKNEMNQEQLNGLHAEIKDVIGGLRKVESKIR